MVKYVDKEKLPRWLDDARLYLPGRDHQRESDDIVVDSDDFVKQKQEIIQEIFSANPKAKTETDLEAVRGQIDLPAALEAVSIDDVKARVKGIDVVDLGDGNIIEKSPARGGLSLVPKSLIQGREISHNVRTREDLVNMAGAESCMLNLQFLKSAFQIIIDNTCCTYYNEVWRTENER